MSFESHNIEAEHSAHIEHIRELPIGSEPRGELMLVLLGEKPATEFGIYNNETSAEEIMQELRSVGIYCEEKEPIGKERHLIAASRNPEYVEQLMRLRPDVDHEKYGQLMGFPKSAIQAFEDEGELIDSKQQKELTKNLPFFNFRLSIDNTEQELDVIRKRNKMIVENCPKLIDETFSQEDAQRIKEHILRK